MAAMESPQEAFDWVQTRERLLIRWPALDADELDATQGDVSALLGLLQGKLGYAEANARQDLQEILRGGMIVPQDVAADPAEHHSTDALPTSSAPAPAPEDAPLCTKGEIVP